MLNRPIRTDKGGPRPRQQAKVALAGSNKKGGRKPWGVLTYGRYGTGIG